MHCDSGAAHPQEYPPLLTLVRGRSGEGLAGGEATTGVLCGDQKRAKWGK